MLTRYTAAVIALIFVSSAAMAQLGPAPSDEPLKRSASIETEVQAHTQTQQSIDSSSAPVSLDDALIAGSRRLGTPRAVVGSDSASAIESESSVQPLGSASPTGLIGSEQANSKSMMSRGSLVQTGLALGGVLLLIFGLGQLYKRLARSQGGLVGAMGAGGSAPSGLVEILGRYPLSSKMTLVVMRFDRRILLLSHAGGGRGKHSQLGAMTTLCELDRPEDVASVLLKVRDEEGDSIAQSFARTLREADEHQDQYLDEYTSGYEQPQVRVPTRSRRSAQVLTNDAGDRAEFGVATESEAAAGVLRRRLAAMRPRANQSQSAHPFENQYGGEHR